MRIRFLGRWTGYVAECAGTPPPDYPLGVDLDTAVRWLWRVRRWRYTLSANLSQGGTVTWTHSDSLNPPPGVRSGGAHLLANVARTLTVPAPDTDPRLDESALLAPDVDVSEGWGKAYQDTAGFGANVAGQRDATHADPALAASTAYPFTNPGRALAARYQLISVWQDPYFPYPDAPPADAPPIMYHSSATDLYYPRLLLFAQVTAVAGAAVPADGADQGVAVALATPAALAVPLPGFAAPLGSLLANWQAAAVASAPVVGAYPEAAHGSVRVDGHDVPAASLIVAGYGLAPLVSTAAHSAGGTVTDIHAGTFDAPALSLSLSLDPAEYWPYADQSGTPLYDTSTGAIVLTGPDGGPADPVLAPYP